MNAEHPDDWNGLLDLRVGVTIFPSQDRAIDKVLRDLAERCPAQFILLLDTSGQLVAVQGSRGENDLVALSSLIAGDMAASQEIARMTGQYQTCQLVIREGQKANTIVCEAGQFLILFMQISTDVPLGWARLLIREGSKRVAEIIATPPDTIESLDLGLADENVSDAIDSAIDSLWG